MYCTLSDLLDRGLQDDVFATQDINDISDIDMAIVNKAIEDATVVIDGYLSGRYSLPFVNPPLVLTKIACDMTMYFMQKNRPRENVREKYDGWISYLKDVARGLVVLDGDSSLDTVSGSSQIDEIIISVSPRIFGR
jgi:phage gp36-like protein